MSAEGSPLAIRELAANTNAYLHRWRSDVLRLQGDWRVEPLELLLKARMKCVAGWMNVQVLVDTGAKIPVAFRKGLVDRKVLKEASFLVKVSVADGQQMEGGTHGMSIQLHLPVRRNRKFIIGKCVPLFGYEAAITGADVIIGYPFLKAFHLKVDTANDCLTTKMQSKVPMSSAGDRNPSSVLVNRPTSFRPSTGDAQPAATSALQGPSDQELQCLYFCKGVNCLDCCQAANCHRLGVLVLSSPISPVENFDTTVLSFGECATEDFDILGRQDFVVPSSMRRLSSSDWSYVPHGAHVIVNDSNTDIVKIFRSGKFVVTTTMFRRIVEFGI